ncbi:MULTISPECIES: hypothetical protein [unclassified Pseudomonas]|uniref:hypothetical protein n=1 Tax=unclassified Pseudomonas TaxID=196821 RepID=UPI000D836EA9|nr:MULTISPECIES: hypothetical protein [unclassified Pseudomonas]PYG78443.1 hypothetical protein N428_02860 [Pseudomonas sp. RV120224-01c]PYG82615.1 hypothetical protein N436_02609 [Pseudomonas sp. RV120224-01b]
MSRMNHLSTAIVLSPGVWRQFIETAIGEEPIGQSALRLAELINSALTSAPLALHRPIELQLDLQSNGSSLIAHLPQLQLAHVTPRSGPTFLLIRLPDESAVDIAAL